jgi:hypothetical protein
MAAVFALYACFPRRLLTRATSPLERLLSAAAQWVLEILLCDAEIAVYSYAHWALSSEAPVNGNETAKAGAVAALAMLACFWTITYRVCCRWQSDDMYVLSL